MSLLIFVTFMVLFYYYFKLNVYKTILCHFSAYFKQLLSNVLLARMQSADYFKDQHLLCRFIARSEDGSWKLPNPQPEF